MSYGEGVGAVSLWMLAEASRYSDGAKAGKIASPMKPKTNIFNRKRIFNPPNLVPSHSSLTDI